MQIVHELGGIPLRQAYTLIKAISKKKHDQINSARARFVKGADEQGLPKKKAEDLFDLILRFAGYGFNKSHSVGYSILAYQTAFVKTYFPIQFMAAVLTYESDNTDKLAIYLAECQRVRLPDGQRGIEVLPPDINLSGIRFHVVYGEDEEALPSNGHIRFGLSAVKGVGGKAVEAILENRRSDGPFTSLFDFCERVPLTLVNRSTIDALIKAGAFDSVHGSDDRAAMVEALDGAMRAGQRAAQDRESGQTNLFGMIADESEDLGPPPLPEVPPWSSHEQLKHEKAALGFFASRHPLDEHRDLLDRYSNATIATLENLAADTELVLGAMLSSLRTTRTRKGRNPGQKMGLITLEDGTGKLDGVIFAEAFARVESLLEEDAILFFKGKLDRRREEPSLIIEHVIPLEWAITKLTERVRIVLNPPAIAAGSTEEQRAFNDELLKLREMLSREKSRVNGSAAVVSFEIHLPELIVQTSANGLRVPVDPRLPERIDRMLGDLGHCDLLGPTPLQT